MMQAVFNDLLQKKSLPGKMIQDKNGNQKSAMAFAGAMKLKNLDTMDENQIFEEAKKQAQKLNVLFPFGSINDLKEADDKIAKIALSQCYLAS